MSTPHYKKVRKHLSDNCPVMKRVIDRVGPCLLVPRGDDPFTLLVRCVIGQQISTKAADSIYAKLIAAAPRQNDALTKMVDAIEDMLDAEDLQITSECGDLLLQIA